MRISFNKEAIWDGYSAEGFGTFIMLQQYVHGAETQMGRIRDHRIALGGKGVINTPGIVRNLFLDIHYYFICAGKIEELIEKLSAIDDDGILKELVSANRELFRPYSDARLHLEKIEGRLTGRFMSDFIQMEKDSFTIGGVKVDVSVSSTEVLKEIYDEVVRGLLIKPG
jgi:hypothetical protein